MKTSIGYSLRVLCLAAGVVLSVPLALQAQGTFTTIDFPGALTTSAVGINDRQQIVGSYRMDGSSARHGFLFSMGGYTTIDVPGKFNETFPLGINNAGQIVGTYFSIQYLYWGFLREVDGSFTGIGPTTGDTSAEGIDCTGEIVGSYMDVEGPHHHGFLWIQGDIQVIDFPDARETFAHGISNMQIVGSYIDQDLHHRGFLLDTNGFTTIDFPGATGTSANGINSAGQIVGSYNDGSGNTHGFLLTNGCFTTIDFPDARYTIANGINAQGQITGLYGYDLPPAPTHGFLFQPD